MYSRLGQRKACLFCKAPFEGITHRCLSGPFAAFEHEDPLSDYDRGFIDGWVAAMVFRPWWSEVTRREGCA